MSKVFSLQLSGEGRNFAESGYFSRQEFPWGTAVWLTEPDDKTMSRVTVGFITFHPFCTQPEHSHRSEEQVLYVISGTGESLVDGAKYELSPGSYFHIHPHARHVVTNNSTEELCVLVVYVYSPFSALGGDGVEKPWYGEYIGDGPQSSAHTGGGDEGAAEASAIPAGIPPDIQADQAGISAPAPQPYFPQYSDELFDLEALGPVLDNLSQVLEISISLLDTDGRHIFRTGKRAAMCTMLSEVLNGTYCQPFFRDAYTQLKDNFRPHFFFCCCNVSSIIVPMTYHGRVVAYLKCGEILLSTADRETLLQDAPAIALRYGLDSGLLCRAVDELPIEPKSRLYTVAEATVAIAKTLVDQVESRRRQHELDKSRLSLVQEQLAKAKLEKALHESGLKLLQSQVNPHFLFNTLNTISQMAYLEGASKASGLTRDLSELLRYTLRKSEQLIPLTEELGLLRHYINIQKERFGERIRFAVEVDEAALGDLSGILLPCMILQPLVENAVVHGLESRIEGGGVTVGLWRRDGMLMASVADNGCGFNPEAVRARAENRVGLKSTRGRLGLHYGNNFYFSIRSAPGAGCEIILGVPLAVSMDAAVHRWGPAPSVEGL